MKVRVNDLDNLPHHERQLVLNAWHEYVTVKVWFTRGRYRVSKISSGYSSLGGDYETVGEARVAATQLLGLSIGSSLGQPRADER
jgi:hypothetical protein